MLKDNVAQAIVKYATKTYSGDYTFNPKKPSIQLIFHNHWEAFLNDPQVIDNGLRDVTVKEVNKMLICGTLQSGFEIYECPSCYKMNIICYTCKSRFCSSCGIKYGKARANSISKIALDVKHRHLVFTIDERLRDYFYKDRNKLNLLFQAVKDTLFYVFNKNNGKDDTFKPGIIMTLHTFGRALNWNPHIHCLVTEGGMNNDKEYKFVNYIHYESLRKSFMRTLLYKLRDSFPSNSKDLKDFKSLVSTIYKDKLNGFYVYAPPLKDKKSNDAVVDYIIRYTGRPVMAQSRILDYDYHKKLIKYYYEDHKTNERIEVTEHIFLFMKKLIIHIPEPQFKMVRYYGLYATCMHGYKYKVKLLISKSNKRIPSLLSYRRDLIETFNVDPLLCDCGKYMIYVDNWIPGSIGGEKNGPIYD